MASCLKYSFSLFLGVLEANGSEQSPSLGIAFSSFTHCHTAVEGQPAPKGLQMRIYSDSAPLPSIWGNAEGPSQLQSYPMESAEAYVYCIGAQFLPLPCHFLFSLIEIDSKGIRASPQNFLYPNLHLRVCFLWYLI